MTFVPSKANRVFVRSLPLFAWRELTFPGAVSVDEHGETVRGPAIVVPRGHRVPREAIALLTDEALRQLFWVKHVDHAPVPNITPADQLPPTTATCPTCGHPVDTGHAAAEPKKAHKPQRASG